MKKFFSWLFSASSGWIIITCLVLAACAYFQPNLTTEAAMKVSASLINLIGVILTCLFDGLVKVIQANKQSFEFLMLIGFTLVVLYIMSKCIFGRRQRECEKEKER